MNNTDNTNQTLAYESHGNGPAVLFIHGFPLSSELWRPMVSRLAAEFRLILPDLRGMGQSVSSPTATMADFADDLARVLDEADVHAPVHVVGLSMGGYVLFEFFRRHRNRCATLSLIDTRAEPDTPDAAKARSDTANRVRREGSKIVADAMIGKLFGPYADDELRDQWRTIMADGDPAGVAAALEAMRDRPDSVPTLSQIDLPALVVVGEQDAITPIECAKVMHDGIKGSRLEIVPNAGHMTPVETPDELANILRSFWTTVPRT
jgi:3-oxoadipate enol-lactonase